MFSVLVLSGVCVALGVTARGQDKKKDKLTAAEVIQKHVESIGTADAIGAAKSRVLMGNGELVSKIRGAATIGGPAQFASQGNMVLFAMAFNATDYPYEKAAYDGQDVTVGVPNGRRTALAEYLKLKSMIVKEGLLGGSMSSAWPLLAADEKKLKVDYSGLTKFDGVQAHKLKYTPRDGDLRVSIYLEPDTFRHIGTVYEYSIQPKMGATSTASVSQQTSTYTLTEKFSDFKTAEKLTLPFSYSISVASEGQTLSRTGSTNLEWKVKFDNVFYNEKIEPTVFKVS